MIGFDNKKILRQARESEYGPVLREDRIGLLEFASWLERAKARNAKIIPNGVNGCIVITENRYFLVEAM